MSMLAIGASVRQKVCKLCSSLSCALGLWQSMLEDLVHNPIQKRTSFKTGSNGVTEAFHVHASNRRKRTTKGLQVVFEPFMCSGPLAIFRCKSFEAGGHNKSYGRQTPIPCSKRVEERLQQLFLP
ncbi:hypothetical protein KP509_36G003700 [Ceratopteris richardii]|uniref:Uncharacterized protein n=1 Tax=Ceratopteris richardii TaxID=49495 RepID=A0A8T2QAB6_CERRI|nr:hypothetical protein KP509_36G003700 [Ceratopteris richardii]